MTSNAPTDTTLVFPHVDLHLQPHEAMAVYRLIQTRPDCALDLTVTAVLNKRAVVAVFDHGDDPKDPARDTFIITSHFDVQEGAFVSDAQLM